MESQHQRKIESWVGKIAGASGAMIAWPIGVASSLPVYRTLDKMLGTDIYPHIEKWVGRPFYEIQSVGEAFYFTVPVVVCAAVVTAPVAIGFYYLGRKAYQSLRDRGSESSR